MSLNPAKFPIYRLPVLALQEVIKSMGLDVMFFFSLISTKARKILKISLPKHYLHLVCSLWVDKKITVESPSSSDKFVLKFSNTLLDGSGTFQLQNVRYFTESRDTIAIHEKGPLVVMVRELITHLTESFNFPKISMNIQAFTLPETALELLNDVKNLSLPMVRIELGTQNTPAETYKAFLDEGSRITEALIMGCRAPVGFRYTPSEDFHLERFEVRHGPWVNLEDYIHCKHVIVRSDNDVYHVNEKKLNQFFKTWKRSSCRLENLSFVVYQSQAVNFEEVIIGLNGINRTRDQFADSVDIERQDGKKATIRLNSISLNRQFAVEITLINF